MKFQYKIICIILGSLVIYFLAMYKTEKEKYILSYKGVALTRENAPMLSPIFNENKSDPHANFVSNQGCLTCHTKGAEIPNFGKAPIINHQIINNNCNLCHIIK